MLLPSYVRRKPKLLEYIPWFRGPAFTIYPYIYLPGVLYEDLSKDVPLPTSLATLAHEEVHLERQHATSILKYALRYIFARKFRYTEELVAIHAQMRVLSVHECSFDIQDRAKRLASIEYLWCARYEEALADLKNISKLIYENSQKAE